MGKIVAPWLGQVLPVISLSAHPKHPWPVQKSAAKDVKWNVLITTFNVTLAHLSLSHSINRYLARWYILWVNWPFPISSFSNGSFFITSTPSPPPVSFLLAWEREGEEGKGGGTGREEEEERGREGGGGEGKGQKWKRNEKRVQTNTLQRANFSLPQLQSTVDQSGTE